MPLQKSDAKRVFRCKKGVQTETTKELIISAIEAQAGDVSDGSAAHSALTMIIERLQDDEDFVETLQDLFGDMSALETIVPPEIPIPQSQVTAPAGLSTALPCDTPVEPRTAKGKKKAVQTSPEPM